MLGFFMYGHIISFQIFVGGADIRMTCLITGYHEPSAFARSRMPESFRL